MAFNPLWKFQNHASQITICPNKFEDYEVQWNLGLANINLAENLTLADILQITKFIFIK